MHWIAADQKEQLSLALGDIPMERTTQPLHGQYSANLYSLFPNFSEQLSLAHVFGIAIYSKMVSVQFGPSFFPKTKELITAKNIN